jgi:antitoxin VapB
MARTRPRSTRAALRPDKEDAAPRTVHEVTILKRGDRRVIVPGNASWDDFFASSGVDLPDREQPPLQEQDAL